MHTDDNTDIKTNRQEKAFFCLLLFIFTSTFFLFIQIVQWLVPLSTQTFFRGTCSFTCSPSLLLLYWCRFLLQDNKQTNKLTNMYTQAFLTNAASPSETQPVFFYFHLQMVKWWVRWSTQTFQGGTFCSTSSQGSTDRATQGDQGTW